MNSLNKGKTLVPKLQIAKPAGAPRRLKGDFKNQKCPYHFVWCPCQVPAIEEELTRREGKDNDMDF